MRLKKYETKDGNGVKKIFSQYWNDKEFLDELSKELNNETNKFYIAEKDGEILGIVGLRKTPTYLANYKETERPIELYVIASKYQNRGVGNLLGQKIIEEAKKLNFTEILCYSPKTHKESWKFYKKLGFRGEGLISNTEDDYPGMLWKKII